MGPDLKGLIVQAAQLRPESRVKRDAVIGLAERILTATVPPARRVTIVIQREIAWNDSDQVIRDRRAAWKAAVLRGAYQTSWLPPETVRNIDWVQASEDGSRVELWLTTGARILDTCDQITVFGLVDAIAVQEMISAVQRRRWMSVSVSGHDEFKRAAAISGALAHPPVEVVNHQLSPEDLERIAGIRAGRPIGRPSSEPVETGIRLRGQP